LKSLKYIFYVGKKAEKVISQVAKNIFCVVNVIFYVAKVIFYVDI